MPNPETGQVPGTQEGGESLQVTSERRGSASVIHLDGELDLETVPRLRRHLADAVERGGGEVVIDLTDCTFMDSTGLSALLNALRRLTRAGRRLTLVCADGQVLRLMRTTKLDSTFRLRDSVDSALAADGSGRAAA